MYVVVAHVEGDCIIQLTFTKAVLFEMECVTTSEILLLCRFGDLVVSQVIDYIIHVQIFIPHTLACSLILVHAREGSTS